MKHRQLRLLGYALVLVPYWEWEAASAGGGGGGREYLARKLEEALLRSAGGAGQEGKAGGLRRAGEAAADREVRGRGTRERKSKKTGPSAEAAGGGGDERAARKSQGGVEVALDKEGTDMAAMVLTHDAEPTYGVTEPEPDMEASQGGAERQTREGKRIGGSAQRRVAREGSSREETDPAAEKRHARKRKKHKTE